MPAINAISPDKLVRLLGTPGCPSIVDLRSDEQIAASGGIMPAGFRRAADDVATWTGALRNQSAVVVCEYGQDLSPGVAAWLRHAGVDAETLDGGVAAWRARGYALVPSSRIGRPGGSGPSVWVTRARPKVDRIACPWLIRRFIDPDAVFLFVAPGDVLNVAERFGAVPFDVDGVFWSHRGERCTFDTMIEEFQLSGFEALNRLAVIVRGADTAHPEIAPQAAGLLAVSLGLSRMYSDDLKQLEAGMLLYDAFYRWCRDAVDETHDWISHQPKKRTRS